MPVMPPSCQLSGNNIRDLIVAELLNAYEVALTVRKNNEPEQQILEKVFADFVKVGSKYDALYPKH